MIQKVYIGLGSNLGDRLENFHQTLGRLPSTVEITRLSPVYETEPWGYPDQPAFLNQVAEVKTILAPLELLQELKHLEQLQGREPTFRYGPRKIDLDILLYNNMVYNRAGLIIPHIHMHKRAFVLVPLADLAPELVHPVLGKTIQQLLAEVDKSGVHPYQPSPESESARKRKKT